MPRNTAVFAPTFNGEGIVRSDDITKDPRFGRNAPYYGMPKGHLPVRSYLAVPVISRTGEVLGGLFFGHPRARRVRRSRRARRGGHRRPGRDRHRQGQALPRRAGRDRAPAAHRRGAAAERAEPGKQGQRAHGGAGGGQCAADPGGRRARTRRGPLPASRPGRAGLRPVHARSATASSPTGTPAPNASRAISHRRSSDSISRASIPTDDRAAGMPRRALETAVREGTFEAEGLRVRKDGSRFWASVVINPIHDEDGNAARLRQDHARRHRAARSAAGAGARAGAAAPGAEDGGDRPAHRRRRARLQQSADRHHRQSRIAAARARRRRARRRSPAPARSTTRCAARSGRPRSRSGCSPSRAASRSIRKPVDVNRLVTGMSDLLRRTLGEQIAIETVLAGGLWRVLADPNQLEIAHPQPRRQRARRHAGRRQAHDRDRQRLSRRGLCRGADRGACRASTW